MSWTVVLLPEAEAELSQAAAWYGEQDPEAAIRFNDAFQDALVKLQDNPFLYQVIETDIRRIPLARFRHGLLYWIAPDVVVVASCFHGSRDPARWRDRLKR